MNRLAIFTLVPKICGQFLQKRLDKSVFEMKNEHKLWIFSHKLSKTRDFRLEIGVLEAKIGLTPLKCLKMVENSNFKLFSIVGPDISKFDF